MMGMNPEKLIETGHGVIATSNFWRRVTKGGTYDCWDWTGYNERGYGKIATRSSFPITVQRVSWMIHKGKVSKGEVIRNICGNRACVNPVHLAKVKRGGIESRQINFMKKVDKGDTHWIWQGAVVDGSPRYNQDHARRMAVTLFGKIKKIPKDHLVLQNCEEKLCVNPEHSKIISKYDAHPKSKLDPATVMRIYKERQGGASLSTIAKKYEIDPSTVSYIGRGLRWASVTQKKSHLKLVGAKAKKEK